MPDIDVKTILLDGEVLGRDGDDLASVPLPATPTAAIVSFVPTGTIAATNVQAAIAEVAAETTSALAFRGTKVERLGVQSIGSASWTTVAWNFERFDVGGWHDNAANNTRITPGVAGYYRASAIVAWSGNPTGDRYMAFSLNGTRTVNLPHSQSTGGIFTVHNSDVFLLAASDYLELAVYQDSGTALDLRIESSFTVQFLGA